MFLDIDRHKKDNPAVKDNEGYFLTYGELVKEVLQICGLKLERSVVFCMCKNTVGALTGYMGLIEAGLVPVMLSAKSDMQLLKKLYDTYSPSYIWMPEDMSTSGQKCIYRSMGYSLIKTGNPVYPLHKELELLMTTSGSTGSPRLVRYKTGNLKSNAQNVAEAFGWTENERPMCDLGMQYTMGLNVINTHLYVGAQLLLTTYNLMSGEFWDYIRNEGATSFTGVPFSYEILSRLRFSEMELPQLRTLCQGGGRLTDKRFEEYAEYAEKSGKRFVASFGTTETAARLSVLPAEEAKKRIGSIGKAIPQGEMFLTDETGNILTDQEAEGELCYRGPNVTMGYACCKNDLNYGDEWKGEYHTGDLARRDRDGFYYITGRKSRFLKLLSYRVSLDQCERIIQENTGAECACTGTDERMLIYITDSDAREAVSECISQKTGLFRSLFAVRVIDTIPRNDSGKIRYQELGI